jgi:uncharacterized protein YutE (UPF0331/DUF86 family)
MIDAELVIRKLVLIAGDLAALEPLARLPVSEFLAGPLNEPAAERLLERMIGRMIDVNYHVATELGERPPKDYFESFVALGRVGVLPVDFARRIASSAGLRNRIAHEYDTIDPVRVHEALGAALADVPEFVAKVKEFLESARA